MCLFAPLVSKAWGVRVGGVASGPVPERRKKTLKSTPAGRRVNPTISSSDQRLKIEGDKRPKRCWRHREEKSESRLTK